MKKGISIALALIMLLALMAGCGTGAEPTEQSPAANTSQPESQAPETPEADTSDIIIGNIQDLSGGSSVWGLSYKWGAEKAAEEINAAGGIDGRMIKVITYDTKGNDVNEGINAYNRLADQDGAVAAMGLASNIGIAIAPCPMKSKCPW